METEVGREDGDREYDEEQNSSEPVDVATDYREGFRDRIHHHPEDDYRRNAPEQALRKAFKHERELDEESAAARILHVLDKQLAGKE